MSDTNGEGVYVARVDSLDSLRAELKAANARASRAEDKFNAREAEWRQIDFARRIAMQRAELAESKLKDLVSGINEDLLTGDPVPLIALRLHKAIG